MKDITKKLYINEGRDYLEVRRRRDKVEVQGREIPLSEHDRPYLVNDEDDDTYQSYEEDLLFDLPDWPPFPDAPPGPCSAEDGCGHVTIMRDYPAKIECGGFFWFRTTHEVHGCNPPGGAAAILAWGASTGTIQSSAVGAKWQAPGCCHDEEVVISVSGPGGDCQDNAVLTLQCECCEAFEIDGPETVNPNNTWTGSLSPPCPGAKVFISSNSECAGSVSGELNEDGDEITVSVGAVACGSIELTVADQNEGCETPQAYHSIRINQGSNGGQCVAGWEAVLPRTFYHYGPLQDPENYSTGWCPGAIFEWLGYCPPLCGWCRVRGPYGDGCDDCTEGRYKIVDIGISCCCGFDWDGGTEWEQETYRYSIRPCQMGEAPPCGCSAAANCPVGYWCGYDGKYTTGEVQFHYNIEEWIGTCA